MTLLNVLKDCPYDQVIILKRVFDTYGREENYVYAYVEKSNKDSWCLSNSKDNLILGPDIKLRDKVCGFYYKKNDLNISDLPKTDVELVIYSPITWVIYSGGKEETINIQTGYDAEVKRSTYGNN